MKARTTIPQVADKGGVSRSVRLKLTREEWKKMSLIAVVEELSEQDLLSGWVRAGLSHVQWLGTIPIKR